MQPKGPECTQRIGAATTSGEQDDHVHHEQVCKWRFIFRSDASAIRLGFCHICSNISYALMPVIMTPVTDTSLDTSRQIDHLEEVLSGAFPRLDEEGSTLVSCKLKLILILPVASGATSSTTNFVHRGLCSFAAFWLYSNLSGSHIGLSMITSEDDRP